MEKRFMAIMVVLSVLLMAVGCTAEEKKVEIKDAKDKVSYSIGLNIGKDFKAQGIEVDTDLLSRGVLDALSGAEPLLSEEEMKAAMMDLQKEVMAKMEGERQKALDENLGKGREFLAENGKKEGVVTLPSGLQYKVLEEGEGKTPTAEASVTVHYRGTLIDGQEFDSSYGRGEPATFPVGGVIAGWTEALQLMKEGAKWQLFIPSELAYGERGAGAAIGPNSALIFDVELISVN